MFARSLPFHTLHKDDPRNCGILHKANCRSYREQLNRERSSNIWQGLMIAAGMTLLLAWLFLQSMEMTVENEDEKRAFFSENSQLRGLWLLWQKLSRFLAHESHNSTDPLSRNHYCRQRLNTKRIFTDIKKQVLNQEQALKCMERSLHIDRQFKSVALLGPPGVGKTLTAMTLRQLFPWPENVHAYSWSTYVPDEAQKFHMVRYFVDRLSSCGQNLLIIDNLSTCDYGIVPICNRIILEREGELKAAANQSVIVVYIFSLETSHYWEQFELLQQLPLETSIINFRPFSREEINDCLNNELRLEQRELHSRDFKRVLDETDAYATGCKRLRQFVLKFGFPKFS